MLGLGCPEMHPCCLLGRERGGGLSGVYGIVAWGSVAYFAPIIIFQPANICSTGLGPELISACLRLVCEWCYVLHLSCSALSYLTSRIIPLQGPLTKCCIGPTYWNRCSKTLGFASSILIDLTILPIALRYHSLCLACTGHTTGNSELFPPSHDMLGI